VRFQQFSVDDGLSNSKIWSIYQDDRGFIWIANGSSIDRYNGYSFESNIIPELEALNIDHFICFLIDDEGYKYIGTQTQGLLVISPDGKTIDHYVHDSSNPSSISHNYVDPIIQDSRGDIWVGTYGGGINLYDKSTKSFTTKTPAANDKIATNAKNIYRIKEGPRGDIWYATDGGGLYRINHETHDIKQYINDPNKSQSLPTNFIFDLSFDNQNRLWLATYEKGLSYLDLSNDLIYNFSDQTNRSIPIASNFTTSVSVDGDKGLWIGYQDEGLDYFDFSTKKITHHSAIESDEQSLISAEIYTLFKDQEENMWIGSPGGLCMIPRTSTPFGKIVNNYDHRSISSNNIEKIIVDKNGVFWIAHKLKGIDKYDPRSGQMDRFHSNASGHFKTSNDSYHNLTLDNQGHLWAASKYGGLLKIDIETNKTQEYNTSTYPKSGLPNDWIFSVNIDKEENIWVSYTGGFSVLKKQSDSFKHYLPDPKKKNWYDAGYIYDLLVDSKNRIWVFTEKDSIFVLDQETQKLTSQKSFISHKDQGYYYEDDVCHYYADGKIYSTNLVSQQTTNISFKNDFLFDIIFKDNDGDYWFTTNTGLWFYNTSEKSYRQFTKSDGLLSNQLNRSIFQDEATNILYFITDKGVNYIDKKSIGKSDYVPPVHISRLEYYDALDDSNTPIYFPDISARDKITLP